MTAALLSPASRLASQLRAGLAAATGKQCALTGPDALGQRTLRDHTGRRRVTVHEDRSVDVAVRLDGQPFTTVEVLRQPSPGDVLDALRRFDPEKGWPTCRTA